MSTRGLLAFFFACANLLGAAQTAVQPLPGPVNTPGDETAPFLYSGRLYFTASLQQEAVQRIFSSNGTEVAQTNFNPKDSAAHAADFSLTPDAQRMYFTTCNSGEYEIWSWDRNYEGDWKAAQKLPRNINAKGSSARQATVGFDQTLKKDVFYFSAQRPGAPGGWDIWGSVIERDFEKGEISYGMPFLLPFNTPSDEVTPVFHTASQTLFFSSNGLAGQGGQDIFLTKKPTETGVWAQPENPGTALNSAADDIGYTFHTCSQKGFFASNRPRGTASGFDIYEATPMTEIHVRAVDIADGSPINGTAAEVFDEKLGRSSLQLELPFDTCLVLRLAPESSYRIALRAPSFASQLLTQMTGKQVAPLARQETVRLFRDEFFSEKNREQPGQVFPAKNAVLPVKETQLPF